MTLPWDNFMHFCRYYYSILYKSYNSEVKSLLLAAICLVQMTYIITLQTLLYRMGNDMLLSDKTVTVTVWWGLELVSYTPQTQSVFFSWTPFTDDHMRLWCSNHRTVYFSPLCQWQIYKPWCWREEVIKLLICSFSAVVSSLRAECDLTKQPWSIIIINLASNTPHLPLSLDNCSLSISLSTKPLAHLPLLSATSSLCWVSSQIFSLPRWANRTTPLRIQQTVL